MFLKLNVFANKTDGGKGILKDQRKTVLLNITGKFDLHSFIHRYDNAQAFLPPILVIPESQVHQGFHLYPGSKTTFSNSITFRHYNKGLVLTHTFYTDLEL